MTPERFKTVCKLLSPYFTEFTEHLKSELSKDALTMSTDRYEKARIQYAYLSELDSMVQNLINTGEDL